MAHSLLQSFNVDDARAATPVFLVEDGAIDGLDVPESLKKLARLNRFSGEAGAVLSGEGGVLYGVGDGTDALITAGLSDKLPDGVYHFATSLTARAARLACLGWLMGAYRFDRYKTASAASARLIAPENVDVEAARRAAEANMLARDLVNTPAGDMTPEAIEAAARALAKTYGAEIAVTLGDALLTENFPMIHAVGRAAASAPRLIDLAWGRADAPKLTLIGKGVAFDSGGLNIKNAKGMSLMKKDMGGAAHALALGQMVMGAGLDVRLRVLVPAVENAISGNAFRPGDVLASRKGLTVEIGNTDAEGRLILADALALAAEEKPDLVVTLATLTGAARVALGPELVPFYCDDDGLADRLSAAAESEADPLWRMPLWANYQSMLSSSIADVNHISGNAFAGSVIAALFLKRFAGDHPWVHFDLYAWRPKAAPGRPVGAEAQAIRALYAVFEQRFG
ncbi:MAG: leucyl aminopeptidase family protein [Pseudomonadota bacterium]